MSEGRLIRLEETERELKVEYCIAEECEETAEHERFSHRVLTWGKEIQVDPETGEPKYVLPMPLERIIYEVLLLAAAEKERLFPRVLREYTPQELRDLERKARRG